MAKEVERQLKGVQFFGAEVAFMGEIRLMLLVSRVLEDFQFCALPFHETYLAIKQCYRLHRNYGILNGKGRRFYQTFKKRDGERLKKATKYNVG